MARKKIKPQEPNKGKKVTVNESPNYDSTPSIFSLEKVVGDNYCFSQLNDEDKKQFAESIFKRKNLPWKDIKKIDRHGLGIEKIPKHQIKGTMPQNITEDFEEFLAFRFNGKKPMVGYREKNIFYVLWFDHNFTLYKH